MKRKHDSDASSADGSPKPSKKPNLSLAPNSSTDIHSRFHPDLFKPGTLTSYHSAYQESEPYRHGVIPNLISDELLRSVRSEISAHISFTPKETDIYKIQQSGDLANLDGLDSAQLAHLPDMVKLRDALYSAEFRTLLEGVTGAGKLSGEKTDMAINIYTPGSYLLCHDDVIGSRRVSYILYLTDPDESWQAEWGGGLRLYATETKTNGKGKKVKVPKPEHAKVIPPSWDQLSFFAVQPGESFHDVEEVYHPRKGPKGEGNKRLRMAISGWYHIPQEGEEGYEEGLEQKLAERSSLNQLQGKEADEFDEPRPHFVRFDEGSPMQLSQDLERGKDLATNDDPNLLSESDLEFLLQYISPSYLTPEMAEQLASSFEEDSVLHLDQFLYDKFASALKEYVSKNDSMDPSDDFRGDQSQDWKTARPPHKHRFLFQQVHLPQQRSDSTSPNDALDLPFSALLNNLFPSTPFRKWLSIITGLKIEGDASLDLLARRFRKGKDYALASAHEGENSRLEFCLGATPTDGWGHGLVHDMDAGEGGSNAAADDLEATKKTNGKNDIVSEKRKEQDEQPQQHVTEVGGEEIYMAADDDDDADDDEDEDETFKTHHTTTTVSPPPQPTKHKPKSDPAIYKFSKGDEEEEDDAILFTNPPTWNSLSIVLRDKGTLRFVKYVSAAAPGDRWDIKGVVVPGEGGWDEDEEDREDGEDGEEFGGCGDEEGKGKSEESDETEEEDEDQSEDDSDET